MLITRKLADDCPNGLDCPRIFELEDGRLLVQGATVTDPDLLLELGLTESEAAVVVPPSLRIEALDALDDQPQPTAKHRQIFQLTANSLVIAGELVTDPDLTRRLPDYESFVTIEAATLHQAVADLKEAS
jgi:hypothetical protein